MLYMKIMEHFNIPQNKFTENNIYTSITRIGNTIVNGYIGPDTASAISNSKIIALKKSFSEILERRALMFGGIGNEHLIQSIELFSQRTQLIDRSYSTYSSNKEVNIDTTGTASHYNSQIASFNALKELIEKNALFLFWYGKIGLKLSDKTISALKIKENKIFKHLSFDKKILFYQSNFFDPLSIIFCFIIDENKVYSSGVGTSFDFYDAIEKALEEAYLLLWKNESLQLFYREDENYKIYTESYERILFHLNSYKIKNEIRNDEKSLSSFSSEKLSDLLSLLPVWIKEIYLIPLLQVVSPRLKCVKIFSPYMYNHIPLKKNIYLDNPMNKHTINLTQDELDSLPDCIVN